MFQSDIYVYAVLFLVLGVLPLGGIVVAFLIAGWPERALTRGLSLAYTALALAYSIFWTVINWKPGDALWTELHVGTVVLAGLAFAMATRLRQPPARTPAVVRVVGAVACMLVGIALVLVILMGTSEG